MGLSKRLYDAIRFNLIIFPGVTQPKCADFLAPYYGWLRQRQGALRTVFNLAFWTGFQLYVPIRARQAARFWNRDDDWRARAIRWGRKYFVDPGDIAAHENADEADFRFYQRRFEQIMVIRAIESDLTDHAPKMIDKAQFQRHCERLSLPVPRLFARVVDGRVERTAQWHPGDRILVKPVRGSGGYGIAAYSPADTKAFDRLLSGYGKGEWLVQEAVPVHPDLADIAMDALSTARIVTLRNEAGEPEIVSASIRFAITPGIAVDNNHFGGPSALIDMATGRLGLPMEIEGPAHFDRHPTTGAQVEGRIVPDWEATKALAVRAHSIGFSDHVLIGWDIGFGEKGPVLIEANQRPNVRLTQRIEGKGIGEMRYGEIIAWHLDRAMTEGKRSRRRFLTRS